MSQPLRNVLAQDILAVPASDVSIDLPVNPLYCILYTLLVGQAAASATTDTIIKLTDVLAAIPRIEVLFRGTTIVSGSLADICVMNAVLTGYLPWIVNQGDSTGQRVALTVPIYLGRPWMKGMEAFPATRRGELTLRRVINAAPPEIDSTTVTEQIETIEILGATPASFLKYITVAKTFLTTGDNDIDFPLGNSILGALHFGTTGYTSQPPAATWNQLKMLVDGVEWTYARTNWATLQGDLNRCIEQHSELQSHNHTENLAAAYAADVPNTVPSQSNLLLNHYAFLDFDPWEDEKYLLQTQGRGRVWLRATAGAADAARMLPLEIIDLSAPGAAAG